MPVNPNEAPPGFVAVPTTSSLCSGCAFADQEITSCLDVCCLRSEREDRECVIFIPITSKPATANWPYDDMGTPV